MKAGDTEFLFNKVSPPAYNFIERRLHHRFFPVIFENVSEQLFYCKPVNDYFSDRKKTVKPVCFHQ